MGTLWSIVATVRSGRRTRRPARRRASNACGAGDLVNEVEVDVEEVRLPSADGRRGVPRPSRRASSASPSLIPSLARQRSWMRCPCDSDRLVRYMERRPSRRWSTCVPGSGCSTARPAILAAVEAGHRVVRGDRRGDGPHPAHGAPAPSLPRAAWASCCRPEASATSWDHACWTWRRRPGAICRSASWPVPPSRASRPRPARAPSCTSVTATAGSAWMRSTPPRSCERSWTSGAVPSAREGVPAGESCWPGRPGRPRDRRRASARARSGAWAGPRATANGRPASPRSARPCSGPARRSSRRLRLGAGDAGAGTRETHRTGGPRRRAGGTDARWRLNRPGARYQAYASGAGPPRPGKISFSLPRTSSDSETSSPASSRAAGPRCGGR